MEMINKPVPFEGMDATLCIGSDEYGGKIIEVSKTRHQIIWQRIGHNGPQQSFTRTFTRRSNGDYMQRGSKNTYLKLGVARTELDQGF